MGGRRADRSAWGREQTSKKGDTKGGKTENIWDIWESLRIKGPEEESPGETTFFDSRGTSRKKR